MTSQPDPGQALSVGAVVADTYQVTRLLGRGGMGSVWEASHLRLPGKRVAIKVLHADIASDQEALARFRREAEIATRLGHPNIVEVHDFNALPDGQPYLVLELLVGESLDSRMRRAPVSLDNAMRIAGQIGAALAAAHRQEVVHRDLKPQNVFLVRPRDDDGEGTGEIVKVLDFGISKIRGSQTVKTLDSAILGTPQYMAPEQATGNHASVDARTDVFALGAIVYEMLAGRPAFSGQSIPEVVFKVVYEQPPALGDLVPGLPRRVVDAIGRALAKQQAARFPDVVSFVEQMAGVSLSTLRRAPITLPPPAPLPGGMDSTVAAPLAPPTPRAAPGRTAPGPASERPAESRIRERPAYPGADPLANTVDSGRRELAAIASPQAGRAAQAQAGPAAQAQATEMTRPRRGRAWLLGAALLLLAGGGAAAALLARSSGEPSARSAAGRSARPPGRPLSPAPAPSAAPSPSAAAAPIAAEAAAAESSSPRGSEPAASPAARGAASALGSSAAPGSPSPAGSAPGAPRPAAVAAADRAADQGAADRAAADSGAADSGAAGRAAAGSDSSRFAQLRPEPPAPKKRAVADRPPRDADGDEAGDDVAESRADLRAAILEGEQALRAGDYRQALVLAERAIRHGAGQAAHALRARASCGIGDLGNARASFVRIGRRHQFLRRRVVASCARHGIELVP